MQQPAPCTAENAKGCFVKTVIINAFYCLALHLNCNLIFTAPEFKQVDLAVSTIF